MAVSLQRPFIAEKYMSFELSVRYLSQSDSPFGLPNAEIQERSSRLASLLIGRDWLALGHLRPVGNGILTLRLRKRPTDKSKFDCVPAFYGVSGSPTRLQKKHR